MTEQPNPAGGAQPNRDASAPAHDAAAAPHTRRRLIAAIAVGVVIAVAAALALGLRGAAPSLATSGIIQGDVRVRAPGRSDWQPLRSISAPIVAGTSLRATQTGRLALTLTDGTSLRIDAGSQLTIDSARQLDLGSGIAYLDVSSSSAVEPYTVTTPLGTVGDITSQVEVGVTPETLRLRVRDGDARVVTPTGADAVASTGEQLRIGADGEVVRDYVMPHDPQWAWVETLAGTPIVDGRPLTQFLGWVARETGRPIRYDSPLTETAVGTAVLRGTAENLAPMEALDVMLSTTEFDYSLRWDGSILITPRR